MTGEASPHTVGECVDAASKIVESLLGKGFSPSEVDAILFFAMRSHQQFIDAQFLEFTGRLVKGAGR